MSKWDKKYLELCKEILENGTEVTKEQELIQ